MVASRPNTLWYEDNPIVNRNYPLTFIIAAWLVVMLQDPVTAQTDLPRETTNTPPEVIPTLEVPPVVTNQIPVVKPKIIPKSSEIAELSTFFGGLDGKYSVSGRTLKIPAPAATVREATSWKRNLDFGMNMAKGNSDTLRYSLGVDAVKEQDANTIRIKAHGTYGESDGVKDTENAEGTARYERLLTPVVYALANMDGATDPIAELDYRVTGILSPGFRLIHSNTTILNLEIGAGYVDEKKDTSQDGYAAGRAAITAEKLLNDHVLGWATAEYIPKLADTTVYFVNGEVGLAAYITRDLSLNVCYQERYDSAPVEGVKSSDTILSTALSLNF